MNFSPPFQGGVPRRGGVVVCLYRRGTHIHICSNSNFAHGEFVIGFYNRVKHQIVEVPLRDVCLPEGDHFMFEFTDAARSCRVPYPPRAAHDAKQRRDLESGEGVCAKLDSEPAFGENLQPMFGLFGSKPVVDEASREWLFESYAWALRNFGSDIFYEDTILVTPTNEHFPGRFTDPDSMVRDIFARVKKFAGMEQWACDLVAQEPDVNPVVAPTIVVRNSPRSPAGTFSVSDEHSSKVVITYNPDLVGNPEALIATLAHELSHYLCGAAKEHPPGGEEFWEHATDLVAIFTGFGLFIANSAFQFRQFTGIGTQGWAAQSRGYLTREQATYALAIFCELKSLPRNAVENHFSSPMRSLYRSAIKEIRAESERLAKLQSIHCPAKAEATGDKNSMEPGLGNSKTLE